MDVPAVEYGHQLLFREHEQSLTAIAQTGIGVATWIRDEPPVIAIFPIFGVNAGGYRLPDPARGQESISLPDPILQVELTQFGKITGLQIEPP